MGKGMHSTEARIAASRWRTAGAAVFIFAATFVVYLPAIHGGFIWDDDAHVTKVELRTFEGLGRIWLEVGATQQYYPLLHSAFWVEHRLWGDEPAGYHVVNVLLHAGVAMLLFAVLRRLEFSELAAFGAAGVFALHPVCVESVAWITEQKNTLSGVFYLSAMLVYLRFEESGEREPRHSSKTRSGGLGLYWAALGLFVLGLLTKTVIATLPAALLVIAWWRRGKLEWRRDVRPLVPWFVIGVGAGLFTAWVEHDLIGAKGEAFDLSGAERVLLAGRVVWFYLGKLVWPVELTFIYPRWEVDAGEAWQWVLGLAGVLIALGVMARRWRGPMAGMLLFVGTLFPVLGFFNVYPFLYSFVADHFQYLASMAVISAVAGLVVRGMRTPNAQRVAAVGLFALMVVLGVMTWRQSGMYADAVSVYTTTLERNPGCWMAHNNLGAIFLDRDGDLPRAMGHFQEALKLRADYPEAHANMGMAYASAGQGREAEKEYREALRLRKAYPEVHNNYGALLLKSGRVSEAVTQFEMAVRYMPDSAEMQLNLAMALGQAQRREDAVRHYRIANQLNPKSPQTQLHWGNTLNEMGRRPEAITHYVEALALKGDYVEAMNNLAVAYAQAGREGDAIEWFGKSLAIEPDSPQVWMNLALACDSAGRSAEALEAAGKALELVGSSGEADIAAKIRAWIDAHQAGAR